MLASVPRHPVAPTAAEQERLREIIDRYQGELAAAQLVGPNGEYIALPQAVYEILTEVVTAMAQGLPVAVVPLHLELTTQEAADFLNVSRQYLVRLLDSGAIPFAKVGTHRRIRFGDLQAYRETRDQQRRATLKQLTKDSGELGLYDPISPEEIAQAKGDE